MATIHRAKGKGPEASAEGDHETTEDKRRSPRAVSARARAQHAHAPARGAHTQLLRTRNRKQDANAAAIGESILATGKLITHVQPATHSLQSKPTSFTAAARYIWLRPIDTSLFS